jgi:hypothetical protein
MRYFEQLVAVVVKVADQRHVATLAIQRFADAGDAGCGATVVDGDAYQLGTGVRQFQHLSGGRIHVGCVGIGHRLHDDSVAAADYDAVDIDTDGSSACFVGGGELHRLIVVVIDRAWCAQF